MAEHRRFWRVWQRYMDAASFVFIDETGTSTSMVRHYGWHPRGERLVDATPHGHWHTTTFVAGLRATGVIPVARTADSKVTWCDAIRRDSPFLREKGNGDDCGDYALGPDRG